MKADNHDKLSLAGHVRTGLGQGAGFTGLDWARAQFIELCGIDPHPGTLNIVLERPEHRRAWAAIRELPGTLVRAPSGDACDAMLHPVSLGRGRGGQGLAAAVVRPDIADYPEDQVEFIAAVNLREHFDPHPGTLNIVLERPEHRRAWAAIRETPGTLVRAPSGDACDAMLHPVSLGRGRGGQGLAAAVVRPDIVDYPEDQVEFIAAVNLREHFDLSDGAPLDAELQQPHAVEAAIFDVDGTLLNSLDGYRVAASRATARYGYTVTDADVRRALNTNQPFWDFVIPEGEPRDAQRIADLRAETMRHFPDALAEVVSVLPGAGDALERLRSAGIRLAVFTGSGGESFAPLRDAGLLEMFEIIVTGRDIERRKPDPQGILQCLDELGIGAGAAAYVGDSCIDVDASLSAGVMAIAVLTGAGDSASLSAAGAHRVSAHIGRVPDLLAPTGTES